MLLAHKLGKSIGPEHCKHADTANQGTFIPVTLNSFHIEIYAGKNKVYSFYSACATIYNKKPRTSEAQFSSKPIHRVFCIKCCKSHYSIKNNLEQLVDYEL